METKTTTRYPRIYINKYGLFFEGQKLCHYCKSGNYFYYVDSVILDSFIIHYHNYKPSLYFRIDEGNCRKFTLPVSQLGIFYRRK